MADWTELPVDILGLFVHRFELMEDYHRFRAVCKSWRSLTPEEEKPKFSLKFPSLMFTEQEQGENEGSLQSRWKLYSQLTSQICEIQLPEATGIRCMGIYPGWILTVGQSDNFPIDIFNPFSRRQITLPSMLHFKDQYEYDEEFKPEDVADMFVRKVVASTSPERDDCILLAIYGEFRILAFARPGDSVWTNINVSTKVFEDVVYYKGKFYAVNSHGVTFVCDLCHKDGPTTTIAALAPLQQYFSRSTQSYLVESLGDLYVLVRLRRGYLFGNKCSEEDKSMRRYFTIGFYTFRLVRDDCSTYPYGMEEVNDLSGRAFFLGCNASTSMPSSDCVRADCVYFCDDNDEQYFDQLGGGGHDTGIFDMERREIEWHHLSQFQFRSPINPPFWYN